MQLFLIYYFANITTMVYIPFFYVNLMLPITKSKRKKEGMKQANTKNAFEEHQVHFTLVELMIVISIILLLAALLMPTLNTSRQSAQSTYCKNNLKQLMMVNSMYLSTWECYVAWGSDKTTDNITRWHGKRNSTSNSAIYYPEKGPLHPYLKSKKFPSCPYLTRSLDPKAPSVERGGGGYGYNIYIGSRKYFVDDPSSQAAYLQGIESTNLSNPDTVVIFTDAAMNVASDGKVQSNSSKGIVAQYSICNAPFGVMNRKTNTNLENDPSIQFRHSGTVNVTWGDGHASSEHLVWTLDSGWDAKSLGFFSSQSDNTNFSPK
jgi:prepilin-type processing-associated H-X9-DG protein